MQNKWNGGFYTLENFSGLHRNSFVQLQESVDHVKFQLPTKHSRVGFLIDKISNSDPDLRSAIAVVCINMKNICDYFEGAAGFYSQCDHM